MILLLILVFGLGIWLASLYYNSGKSNEITQSDSVVLLEKVENVCKLVTIEGNFSELYDETNICQFTVYIPMPSTFNFSKKATLQVTGKVLVGYDLEKITISVDSAGQRIILKNLPEPEILSIDHEVTYKDLDESWFNSFEPEDFTNLNRNAKEVLRQKAHESRLLEEARQQGGQMLDAIRFMVEAAGWTPRSGSAADFSGSDR